MRTAADAEEDAVDRARLGRPPASVNVTAASRSPSSCNSVSWELEVHVDQRVSLDALDQVVRHGLAEPVAANEHRHARGLVREIQDGLTGRVAGADDHDALARALRRLAATRAVVHAATEQLVDAVEIEAAPIHSRRREDDGRSDLGAVAEAQRDRLVVTVEPAPVNRPQERQLRAELLRLPPREPRELRAADSAGKAEEVLDRDRCTTPGRPARRASHTNVESPSDAAYTAAARPAGPAPMTTKS